MTGPQDPQDPNIPGYGQPTPPPGDPGYGYGPPPAGYGPPPGYQPVPVAGAPVRVGKPWPPRINQRPDPKYGVSLAGIGVALAIVGVIVWGGDYLGTSGGGDGSVNVSDSHRVLGIALSLVAIALGYALAFRFRTGPLTTAGVVASAVGVPVLMGFLTFDPSSSGGPFQTDAIALVSIAAWVVSYFWVRGTRGHSFYLGLAAIVLWVYILDKTDSSLFSLGAVFARIVPFGESFGGPDWNTIGGLSLTFGIGYYVAMTVLDQSGRRGAGTPFAVSGFVATVAGILAFSVHAHTKGTAAIFIGFGLALAWVGARSARRFTTWAWAFLMGGGIVTLIADSLTDNNAAAGIVLILIGAALVGVAAIYAIRFGEAPDDPVEAI